MPRLAGKVAAVTGAVDDRATTVELVVAAGRRCFTGSADVWDLDALLRSITAWVDW
ncbi:hypothetical protein MMIN_06660 [Mycolicibacter minnesotensis]|nr:hypothetical protein MMIN_06660 [Mycolicibacter minnesotensis]